MKTAYSLLTVKSVDDEQWTLEGVATTPASDRVGDVVDPKGAVFTLPVPFLWQHYRSEPIGSVIAAQITDEGILVKVQLVKPDHVESDDLKKRLQEAWDSIKTGLVRGLSIGFGAIEYAEIAGTWGIKYTKWDWRELSAVTIPANQEATITSVKSIYTANDQKTEQGKEKSLPCVPPQTIVPTSKHVVVKLFETNTQGVKL